MLTDLSSALYETLVAAAAPGGELAGVPEIRADSMRMVKSGGIAVEIEGPESYQGGSENRRDFCTGIVRANCVVRMGRDTDHLEKLEQAEALAKQVRRVVKANPTLGGFALAPARVLRVEAGWSVHDGTSVAVAAVIVQADYIEEYS